MPATIAPPKAGPRPIIETPMRAFLEGTHRRWLQEVRAMVEPAREGAAGTWLRWRAIDYLENGFKRRFERERQAVQSLHQRLTGEQASHLWAAGELTRQLLESLRHHVGLCQRAEQFSTLADTLLRALEYWCGQVEDSLGRVRWGDVPTDSRRLFEQISYDEALLEG